MIVRLIGMHIYKKYGGCTMMSYLILLLQLLLFIYLD